MTRRVVSAAQLAFNLAPQAPTSGVRAVPHELSCPGLVADARVELVPRRRGDCKHLGDAELAWIQDCGGAQAQCPAWCCAYAPAEERELVQIGRSSALPVATKAGRVRSPQGYVRDGVRLCSRCRKRPAREPKEKAWGKTARWQWCAPCTQERQAEREAEGEE